MSRMLPILFVVRWGPASKMDLGDEIGAYARSKIGEKVGNGECTSLQWRTPPVQRPPAGPCAGNLGR